METKPKILITGAVGFVGFHLMQHFHRAGFDVVGTDRTDEFDGDDIRGDRLGVLQEAGCRMVFGDLATPGFVTEMMAAEQPALIFHLAARANARSDDWAAFERDNVQALENLLAAAHNFDVEHFLFASTSSVYGEDAPRPFREDAELTTAKTPYEKTKQQGEAIIQHAADKWGMPATIIRFFNMYGPWGRHDMAPYIFTDRLANDIPVTLYNGETERTWLYIDDAVKACSDLAAMPPASGDAARIVNVVGPELVKTIDLLNMIAAKLGKTPQIQHEAAAVREITSNPGDVERLRALTKSTPQTSFEQGIDKFLEWYKEWQAAAATN